MKTTVNIRRIDELGRLTLPMEMRRRLYIDRGDQIEILLDDDRIVLKKYDPVCVFCGAEEELTLFSGKSICAQCFEGISKARSE